MPFYATKKLDAVTDSPVVSRIFIWFMKSLVSDWFH